MQSNSIHLINICIHSRSVIILNKTCCFAGHSEIYSPEEIYDKLTEIIEKLIITENIKDFMVGNYGNFDKLSAKAVRKLKEKYPDIRLNLVVPYLTKEINEYKEMYYKNYDCILMADICEKTPKNLRIIKCNEYMVKKSDCIICYVNRSYGGAAKTLEFAEKQKNIRIFNMK